MIRTLMLLCALAAGAAAQSPAQPQPGVSGRTVDEKGQPVRKVALTLLPLGSNDLGEPLAPYGTTSDNAGGFEFYGVPAGRYRLMGERAGYLKTYYGARSTWAKGSILTLRASESLTGVRVRMVEQSVISGKTIDPEGASGANVLLFQQRYRNGRREWVAGSSVRSDEAGEFRMNKLAPGRYRLAARGSSTGPDSAPQRDILAYYPGVADAESAEVIELRRGQTVSNLGLALLKSPTFTVSGTVAGRSSSNSRVQMFLYSSGEGVSATAIATGEQFKLSSVVPGSYVLSAMEASSGPPQLIGMQPIKVSGSNIEGLAFDLSPSAGLHGTVKFAGEAPAGVKLRIQLTPVEGFSSYGAQADVAVDGTFTIPGSLRGALRYEVQGLPAGAYIKSAVYGDQEALGELNLARIGGDEKLEIVVGLNAARISGIVRDEQGKVLDGVVTLIPDPPQPQRTPLYQRAETDEYGRFQFQGLRPGKFRLYAWEELEDGAQFDPDVTAPLQARSLAVEVAEGERKEVEATRITVDEVEAARAPR